MLPIGAKKVNCTAHVTSPLDSLKWIPGHDGQSDIQQVYLTNTTVVMTISSLGGSDAGRYKCMMVMADGREETAEFELMVRRKESNAAACSITQFKCRRTKHCIFLRYRCDGKDDCGDGSDEDCESNPCLNKFRCNNTRCVDNQEVCNHIDNCGDLSDEGPSCSNPCLNKFRCNNTRCVDNQEVCNHIDNCGDLSDEGPSCILGKLVPTTQSPPEDSQFGWLKITMSTVIASTVGVVILISFLIIVVFRVKMKRLRERRTARALESVYRHGESGEATSSGQGDEGISDQRPFLPSGSHHYGNIIVNVNNGVQYLPGYDYSLFVAVPPPYSECGGGGEDVDLKSQPPPYSTIDRNNSGRAADCQPSRQNISVSSVQSCLGGLRGPDHVSASTGPLYQDRTQDLEGLSGITSSFLQSLLGSHCENMLTIGVDSHCQTFPGPGRTCIVQMTRAGSDDRASPTENSNISATARPGSASSSSAVMSQTSSNTATGCDKGRSRTCLMDVTADDNGSACPNSLSPLIDSRPAHSDVVVQEATSTSEHQTCGTHCSRLSSAQDISNSEHEIIRNENQIPICGASFKNNLDTLDQCDVPLLAGSQGQGFLLSGKDVPSLLRKHSDSIYSGKPARVWEHTEFLHTLPPSETDGTLTACHGGSCWIESHQFKPGHPGFQANNLVLGGGHQTDNLVLGGGHQADNLVLGGGHQADNLVLGGRHQADNLVLGGGHQADNLVLGGGHQADNLVLGGGHQADNLVLKAVLGDQATECRTDLSDIDKCSSLESSIDQKRSCSENSCCAGENRLSGELNVKDGCVVLEVPRHTSSSQLLSHLHGVYAASSTADDDESLEAVVNTKRPPGVVARPPLPKFHSDFVLPYRNAPL